MMKEYVEKKRKATRIFGICLLVGFVAVVCGWVGVGVAISQSQNIGIPLMIAAVLFMSWWIGGVIWLAKFLPISSSAKWLEKKGLMDVVDDISLNQPTFPRAKIYCGEKALFSRESASIIPYAEIAWVHLYEKRVNGITVEKLVILHMKDGKKFSLNIKVEEFQSIFDNYIVKQAPNVLLGYGAEQKALYKQMYPEAAEPAKKVKRIWGIILMCLGVVLLAELLINIKEAEIVPVAIMVLGAFGAGAGLYWTGRKK